MPWILGGTAIALFLMVSGKWPKSLPNPLSPANIKRSGPGPAAQAAGATPGQVQIGPFTLAIPQSPNSTLTTVNQSLVIANSALGQFDQLGQYGGSNADSEYPVQTGGTGFNPGMDNITIGDSDWGYDVQADSLYG